MSPELYGNTIWAGIGAVIGHSADRTGSTGKGAAIGAIDSLERF